MRQEEEDDECLVEGGGKRVADWPGKTIQLNTLKLTLASKLFSERIIESFSTAYERITSSSTYRFEWM